MTTPRIIVGVLLPRGAVMKSAILKHSVKVAGRHTTVNLEDAFWNGLREIAKSRHETSAELVAAIKADQQDGTLSSAIRTFVLGFYREFRTQDTLPA